MTRAAILVFWPAQKHNLVEDVAIFLLSKFRLILFYGFKGEVENVSANQRPNGNLGVSIGQKNTNLVDDVVILRPAKFRWILFTGFKEV